MCKGSEVGKSGGGQWGLQAERPGGAVQLERQPWKGAFTRFEDGLRHGDEGKASIKPVSQAPIAGYLAILAVTDTSYDFAIQL